MKIKSILLSSLIIALFTGCSVQSKELDQPLTHAEKEVTVAWKDTLDEGIFDELDRQKVLSELYKENMKQTALVEHKELETEVVDQVETTTQTQQKVTEKVTAPVQSKKETVQAKPKQKTEALKAKAPTTNKETTKPKEQRAAPKPKPEPKPEPTKNRAPFFYEVGNSGKLFNTSEEAWGWAENEMDKNWENPNWYSSFTVRSYFVDDNSPEKWTVHFEHY